MSAIRLVYLSILLVSLSFCYVSAAWADEDTQVSKESSKPAEPQAPERHRFSLVFAPVRLGFGAAWLGGELALTPKWSIAANGEIKFLSNQRSRAGAWSAGLDGRYYVWGSFEHGVPLILSSGYTRGSSDYVYLLALVGYKFVFKFGLTAEAALGGGGRYRVLEEKFEPHASFRLNLGWSF